MQHHHVVAGIDDGGMELRVQPRLFLGTGPGLGRLHLVEDGLQYLEVAVRSQPRGAFGRQPLHVAAEREIIEHRLLMGGKQPRQSRRESRAEHIGHVDA